MATLREELRAALDDSVLTHTGRSIGDLASQRVVDDIWPLIEAREAALLAVVRKVAEADNSDHSVCYQLCSYDMYWTDDDRQIMTHNAPCVAEQALALLSDRAEGEPQS